MEIASNDEYIDSFLYEVDKTIASGNIIYIKNAIINYSKFIDIIYINWANLLILEIVQEKLEYVEL
jgi:hypothetical protein